MHLQKIWNCFDEKKCFDVKQDTFDSIQKSFAQIGWSKKLGKTKTFFHVYLEL